MLCVYPDTVFEVMINQKYASTFGHRFHQAQKYKSITWATRMVSKTELFICTCSQMFPIRWFQADRKETYTGLLTDFMANINNSVEVYNLSAWNFLDQKTKDEGQPIQCRNEKISPNSGSCSPIKYTQEALPPYIQLKVIWYRSFSDSATFSNQKRKKFM